MRLTTCPASNRWFRFQRRWSHPEPCSSRGDSDQLMFRKPTRITVSLQETATMNLTGGRRSMLIPSKQNPFMKRLFLTAVFVWLGLDAITAEAPVTLIKAGHLVD